MARRSYKNKSEMDQRNEDDFRKFIEIVAEKQRRQHNIQQVQVLDAKNRIRDLQKAGWDTGNYTNINYDDILFCIAYLQRYAPCHSALVSYESRQFYRKINKSLKSTLVRDNSFKVASVGGGPGTDILAFSIAVQKMFRNRKDLQLDFTVIDIKHGWEQVFTEVVSMAQRQELKLSSFSTFFRKFHPSCKFVKADVRKQTVDELLSTDVVLLVKVLSNVTAYQRPEILKNIFASMKPGAVFLYMDTFLEVVVREAQNTGMELIFRKEGKFETSSAQGCYYSISKCTYDVCAYQKIQNSS